MINVTNIYIEFTRTYNIIKPIINQFQIDIYRGQLSSRNQSFLLRNLGM